MSQEPEYLLGTNDSELARLKFQHAVWRDLSDAALDRAGLVHAVSGSTGSGHVGSGHVGLGHVGSGKGPGDRVLGARVLDLGCGPGFVARDIAARIGPSGHLTLLDESPVWHRVLADVDWPCPVERIEKRIEDAELPEEHFDLVFSRWVFSFLGDLDAVAAKVYRSIKPGGRVLIQDYNHEGISVFPRSEGFDCVVRGTREFYRDYGGNAWVAAALPAALRRAGFSEVEIKPNVKVGGPDSGVFRWADVFFPIFSGIFLSKGLMNKDERARFLDEWEALKGNPDALFFSPIVCDVMAVKPG